MKNRPLIRRLYPVRVWAALLLLACLAAAGCNTYYIPPPEVQVYMSSQSVNVVVSVLDAGGSLIPSSIQLNAQVLNASNPTILYSVGQAGVFVAGGNDSWGTVSTDGVYTAPLHVPTPNRVVVQATSQQEPTKTASVTLTLLNPTAVVTAVTPAQATAGQTVNLDITGTSFDPKAVVNMSGAQLSNQTWVSQHEIKVTAHLQLPGLLGVSVVNPFPFGAPNAVPVRSLPNNPSTSSSIAIMVGAAGTDANGNPLTATQAYIPEPQSLAVVNLDSGKQYASVVMPPGYVVTMAAANPAQNEVIAASRNSNIVQVIELSSNPLGVARSLTLPVTTTTTVDGATCEVCAMLVDSNRDLAILSTAAGYLSLNLKTGAVSTPLAAPAAAEFAYDASSQRIYAPFATTTGTGTNVVDLAQALVTPVQFNNGVLFGPAPSASAADAVSGQVFVGDKVSSTYLSLNLNNAQSQGGFVQVPAAPFTITSGCAGAWRSLDIDPVEHLGWMVNVNGECVAAADLPPAAVAGTPARPSPIRWARLPNGPDGLPWQNTPLGVTPALAVYTGSDGRAYGLAVRSDGKLLARLDLDYLLAASPVPGGTDSNQVDPTQVTINSQTLSAVSFITLH